MSDIIARESQLLAQDAIVTLFELDVRRWGGGVLRFTADTVAGQPLHFNGYTYEPFPIQATGFQYSGQGTLPQPQLTVSNIDFTFMSLILGADDLVGAPIRRIRTYRKCLDDGTDPDPLATFPVEQFTISQKTAHDDETMSFALRVSFDQQGKMIPGRQCLRTCTHRYRYWDRDARRFIYDGVTCPYARDAYFDRAGNPVTDPAQDSCSKQLGSGCKRRYGAGEELPFSGAPGLQRYNQ